MNTFRLIFVGDAFLNLPAEAQEHRFEGDPITTVRKNFVACDVLSQLQRVMDDPRFLLAGEWVPPHEGDRIRVYVRRAIRLHLSVRQGFALQWTHEKALSK